MYSLSDDICYVVCLATDSREESDSGGDEEEEDDSSSGSESELGLGLGLGPGMHLGKQPQPLPLSGKFPPGVPAPGLTPGSTPGSAPSPHVQGVGGPTAFQRLHFPRDSGCYDAEGKESSSVSKGLWSSPNRQGHKGDSPPAPAPGPAPGPSYHPNIPVSIDSYVVARGKGVSVEPAPRTSLPRTSSGSSSSSRRGGGDSSQGASSLAGSPQTAFQKTRQSPNPEQVKTRDDEDSLFNCSAISFLDKGFEANSVVNGSIVKDNCSHNKLDDSKGDCNLKCSEMPTESGEGRAHSSLTCVNGISGVLKGQTLSEKSSDSGVSSSSVSSSHPSIRDSRRERRNVAVVIEAARQ